MKEKRGGGFSFLVRIGIQAEVFCVKLPDQKVPNKEKTMNTLLKSALALTLASALFTGCSVEDALSDIDESTSGYSGGTSGNGRDSFTITKTSDGFTIHWSKGYSGYSEIIYKKSDTTNPRGDGYPFTNNATGDYTMNCVLSGEDTRTVGYRCSRPDISAISGVRLEKGVEYQWLVSYGTDHEQGEVEAIMEYTSAGLVIQ